MNERPVESTAERTGRMPTEAECVDFARRIEEAVARADAEALDGALDMDAVLESATGGVDGVDEYRQGFLIGAKKQHERTGGLGRMIVHGVAGGGSYRFLRVALVEGQRPHRLKERTEAPHARPPRIARRARARVHVDQAAAVGAHDGAAFFSPHKSSS